MLKRVELFLLLLIGGALAAVGAVPEVDIPKEIPDEPFDIRAASLEFTNETVIASGGVTGKFENATIRADRISGNTETGELRIEGACRYITGVFIIDFFRNKSRLWIY